MIDLRSDTVTKPSPAMFEAASHAEIGDDVLDGDPTVLRLERRMADLLGLEAGLFFPTGTMANLCALLTHAGRGRRVVCGAESHIYNYEAGGASALGGLVYHPLPNDEDGGIDAALLAGALANSDDPHLAPPGVLALENTHNQKGGAVCARMPELFTIARSHSVPVHLDGARVFNAAIALDASPAALVAGADSVQVCLSKGLGAPLGSVLAGSRDFIGASRRLRKQLGGGMRQAGVVAAMGLVGLDDIPHLALDHANALAFAQALASASIDVVTPHTNIVLLRADRALVEAAREEGVLLSTIGPYVRAVTHRDVEEGDVRRAADAVIRAHRRIERATR